MRDLLRRSSIPVAIGTGYRRWPASRVDVDALSTSTDATAEGANTPQVRVSLGDGEVDPLTGTRLQLGTIFLTPDQAKALVASLTAALATVEEEITPMSLGMREAATQFGRWPGSVSIPLERVVAQLDREASQLENAAFWDKRDRQGAAGE